MHAYIQLHSSIFLLSSPQAQEKDTFKMKLATRYKYLCFVLAVLLVLAHVCAAGKKRQHSFDLNKTASFSIGTKGKETGDEEVQSKLLVPAVPSEDRVGLVHEPDPLTIPWGNKKSRYAKIPQQEPIQSVRPNRQSIQYRSRKKMFGSAKTSVRGKPLSGLDENGNCETHRVGCPHWEGLNSRVRNVESSRLSARRSFQDPEVRKKAADKYKTWYHNLSVEERKKMNKVRHQRQKEKFESLPLAKQEEIKSRLNELNRKYVSNRRAGLALPQQKNP